MESSPPAPLVRPGRGLIRVSVNLVVRDPEGNIVSELNRPEDMTLLQFAQLVQGALMAIAFSSAVKDTGGTSRSVPAGSAGTTPQIEFGIGTTPAAFTDHAIQTAAGGTNPVTATVNPISSNTFTVTATWSNSTGSTVTISELAMYIVAATFTFAITHDVFLGQAVLNGNTATATLTFTWS